MPAFIIGKKSFKSQKGSDCYVLVLMVPFRRSGCSGFESTEKFVTKQIYDSCDLYYSYDFEVDLNGRIVDISDVTGSLDIHAL